MILNGSLALDTAGNLYMAMTTLGTNFGISNSMLVSSGAFEDAFGLVTDNALLVKFCPCSKCSNLTLAFQASDTTFCGNACINYNGLTQNIVSSQWSFPGGTSSSSIDENPQGICYDSAGSYNVKLIVTDDRGNRDSLTFINLIKSLAPPPTPVITQHYDTLYCTTDTLYASYQWYDSTTLIPGATDTLLIVTHGGNYNVAVTAPNGCKISVGITIAHDVGINEFSINNLFSLSPNPASDQLTIHTSSHIRGTAIVSIMNVIGEIIQEEKLRWSGDMTINVKTLPAGIYFLQMKTENGIDTKRFVKE
jgi:PKD repeat protein